MKPRIAVFHNLPSGGAKRVLCENLKGLGLDFDFYLYDLKGPYDSFLNVRNLVKKVRSHEFKETFLLPRPFGFLNFFIRIWDLLRLDCLHRRIAKEIDGNKFDLVLVYADRFTQAPLILSHLKTETIYYAHDPYIRSVYEPEISRQKKVNFFKKLFYWPGRVTYEKIIAFLDKKNTKKASKVLICSKYAGLKMKKRYKVNAEVVYPGVDIKVFKDLKVKKDYAVISQGSILYRKGHELVVRSIAEIKKKRPELFILADSGEEDERSYLVSLAKKVGVKIKFFEKVKEAKKVVEIYNRALVCACGQIKEPFNLAVIEANACFLPVVSVNEGGMRETVVNGKNGFLVDRNEKEFGKKIAELLKDDGKRKKMGKWGREYVEKKFSCQVANRALKKKIEGMLG